MSFKDFIKLIEKKAKKPTKRGYNDMPFVSREELLNVIRLVKGKRTKLRNQALITFLYLTAARVEEVIGGTFGKNKEYYVPAITRGDIKIQEFKGQEFLVVKNVITLKRRGNPKKFTRTIPINCKAERQFLYYIYKYLDTKEWEAPLFKITRDMVYKIVKEQTGWYPHFLRDLRNTHLVQLYNLSSFALWRLNNWARLEMAERYVRLSAKDIMKGMKEPEKEVLKEYDLDLLKKYRNLRH